MARSNPATMAGEREGAEIGYFLLVPYTMLRRRCSTADASS